MLLNVAITVAVFSRSQPISLNTFVSFCRLLLL